ncbi:VOC family protein [Bacillus sp. SCS-153A]|uniref:VOC family protein n=1 Tax=Rossellomorea sedimentorum TaxID=3115294 RepID=UPI003905C49D
MSYFTGLLQTNLYVNDINTAAIWYQDTLGLTIAADYGTTVVLAFGDSSSYDGGKNGKPVLCLIENKEINRTHNTTHPVLRISKEYCEGLYNELKENNVEVEENPSHIGHFKFYDPDGNLLEAFYPGVYD